MKTYDMSLLTKKIYDSPIKLFSLKTLRDILNIDKNSSFFKVVNRLIESGVIDKIERKKYVLKNYSGSEFSLANFIYEPSYVSFESALNYYGILSQFPYEVTSSTLRQTRSKEFNDKLYSYFQIKKAMFWGYIKVDNYLIAEKEKALLDQLYLSSKGLKKAHLDEYDLSTIDKFKLRSFSVKYPQTRQFKKTIANLFLNYKS